MEELWVGRTMIYNLDVQNKIYERIEQLMEKKKALEQFKK